MSIISAGNTLLNSYIPDICLLNEFEDGQVLVYDSKLQAFINTTLEQAAEDGRNVFRSVDTVEIFNETGDGFRTTYSVPWETDDKDSLLITIDGTIQHIDAYDLETFTGFTNIVFSEAIANGSDVEIIGLQIVNTADVEKATIIADGISTTYSVPWIAPSEQSLIISINSAKQQDDAYVINVVGNETFIEFDGVPAAGAKIEVLGILSQFIQRYTTTMDGIADYVTVPWAAVGKESLIITIGPVKQHQDAYTLTVGSNESIITFSEVPVAGSSIEVIGLINLSSGVEEVTGVTANNTSDGQPEDSFGIYRDTTVSGQQQVLNFKSLKAGPGIELSADANTITISTDQNSEMVNIGTGQEILKYSVDDVPQFKTLVGDGSITVVDNCDTLGIVYDGDADTLGMYPADHYVRLAETCGVGKSIVKKGTGQADSTLKFKSIVGGQDIVITETDKEIVVSNLSGGGYVNVAGDYAAQPTDYIIGVADTSVQREIELPKASCAGPGKKILVKDESGNAGTNLIRVVTFGSELIDNQAFMTITSNYGFIEFYSNGVNWFVCNRQ